MERAKRIICMALCFAMLAGYLPAPVHAEDLSQQGLCEHHPEHIDCSYAPAVDAVECGHQHEDVCYSLKCVHVHEDCGYVAAVEGVACNHQHDDACGYTAAVAEIPCSCEPEMWKDLTHAEECTYDPAVAESVCTCTPVETVLEIVHAEGCTYAPAVPEGECSHEHGACSFVEAKDEIPCGHDCAKDAACSEKVLTCVHEHDEECGYAEAREAVACDFVCEECANAELEIAAVEEHRYGTVYTPYAHTNDSSKPYSLVDGIYYSTNHTKNSAASYTIAANFDTTISFNYGVSSESGCDEFTLKHNETQLFCISGLDSGKLTIDLSQGDVLVFTYEKDDSESERDDRGWFEITSGDNYLNEELTTPNCRGDVCCLDCGEVLYDRLPHNIITVPAVEPTCTTEGKTSGQVCSECGFVSVAQDPIPMAAHSFVNGICTICETATYSEGITFKLNDDGTFYIVSGIGIFTGESLVIPQTYNRLPVKEIGVSAFANCSKLTSVTIPSSITAIGDKAFHNCTGLKGVYISDLDAWCDISFDYESEWDEGLWVESYSNPLKYAHNLYLNGEKVTDIVLSDAPNAFAFYGCSLNSVTFTCQVGLNTGVFRGSSLREIYIPGGPSYLRPYSLHSCSNISGAFYLPASVTEVGDWTFWGPNIKVMYLEGSKIPDRCDDLDYGNTGPFSGSGANVVYNCHMVQVDGNDYIIKDGEAWFIRCPQTRTGTVEILSQVTCGGQIYNVTKIGDYAFYNCNQITSITIPNSITNIGREAFGGTSSLQRVDISDLASWCNITFKYVSSNPLYYNCELYLDGELITDVQIPDSVTSINDYAFYGCDSLTSITMGSGVTSIGYKVFENCSALSSVILGSGLNSIGVYAFCNCASLTNIVLPDTVTIIDSRAFEDCTGLSSITISGSVTNVGYGVFGGCLSLKNIRFESDAPTFNQSSFDGLTATIEYPAGNDTWTADVMQNYGGTITWIPYDSKHIHDFSDEGTCACGAVGGIFGDQLTWALDNAGTLTIAGTGAMPDYSDGSQAPWYSYAKTVKKLVAKEGITSLSSCGFENPANLGFVNLTEVVLPDSLQSIGSECFQYCRNLTKIQIPEQVTSIGIFAFEYCQGLESIVIPSGVTVISQGAFNHCDSLKSVTIPAATNTIAYGAFDGCTAITDVYYGSREKDWNSISVGSYNDCLLNATIHYTDPCTEGHTEVVDEAVDATCTEDGLTEGRHCSVCGTVTIPQKVISAGGSHSFVGSACEYCGVPGGMCGDTAIWTFDVNTKKLTVSGTGAVTSTPWKDGFSTAHSLVIEEGITELCDHAFRDMSKLSSVQLPMSLKKIPSYCFMSDASLTSVSIPDSVTTIGEHAFGGTGFTTFEIPDSVTSDVHDIVWGPNLTDLHIGSGAKITVRNWSDLDSVPSLQNYFVSADNPDYCDLDGVLYTKDRKTLVKYPDGRAGAVFVPEGTETINAYAFYDSVWITEISIPVSVKEITDNDFGSFLIWNASSLENIHVDENNTAFSSEDGLLYNKQKTVLLSCGPAKSGSVTVSEGTWEIGTRAFHNCAKLTEIKIPNSVEMVGFCAFEGASSLTSLVIPAGVTEWEQFAFKNCRSLQWLACGVKNSRFQEDFNGCSSLKDIYYYGTEEEWKTNSISSYDTAAKFATKHYNSALPGTWKITYVLNDGANNADNPAAYYSYGEDITLSEPVRDGYIFAGWYLDADMLIPAEAPQIKRGYTSGDLLFYAAWKENISKFTVVLDAAGGICNENVTEYISGTVTPLPTNVVQPGYIFLGWYEGDTKVTEIPADATGDKYYVAKWQEKAAVSIDTSVQTFAYDGEGKAFVLKDSNGNLLPVASGNEWLVPCSYTAVTSPFGYRKTPTNGASTYHQGIDLDTGTGWPVVAARAGIVHTAYGSAAGNYITIDHQDGFKSVYMHLNGFAVSDGTSVTAGQLIGYTGSTGVSTDDHLHFGISLNGVYVNPESYVDLDGSDAKYCIDYSYSGAELNDAGLPCNPGLYSIRVTRPETATHKAVDLVIKPAVRIVALSGSCGYNMYWEFEPDTGVLTISGNGSMYSYSKEEPAPWHVYSSEIREIQFDSESLSIGEYAFADCIGLTSITIPDNVYRIGDSAFYGCIALNTITFSGGSRSIMENAFSGVTATAYYPAGWGWTESRLKDYGGKITWVETGETTKKLAVWMPESMLIGTKESISVNVCPWNAIEDCVISIDDPNVLEMISEEDTWFEIMAVGAGTTTVTIMEQNSGLQYSGDIMVVEPEVITVPCTMELKVPEGDSLRYFSFTPETTGTYCFAVTNIEHLTMSDGGYGDGIHILENGEWMDTIYNADDAEQSVLAGLNAGTSYTIVVPFYLSAYEQKAVFTAENVSDGPTRTFLHFYQDQEEITFMPGADEDVYLPVNYNGTGSLVWSCSNPSVLEIVEILEESNECRFRAVSEGTATITVSDGVLSDSITITTKIVECLELYLPMTEKSETDYFHKQFAFVAPEDGRYAFSAVAEGGIPTLSFNSWSSEANILFGYGENSCTAFRNMKAGEICEFDVYGHLTSCTVRVSKAIGRPLSMKLITTERYGDRITVGASFAPGNACDRIVKWEINSRDIASEMNNPDRYFNDRNNMTYETYGEGTFTVTATSESGLKASLTVTVSGENCQNGHTYGEWIHLQDASGNETGRERRTCIYCGEYQERRIPPLDETVPNRVVIDYADMAGQSVVWIDGMEYALQKYGDKCYVDLPDSKARTLITYTYSASVQSNYPVGMKVWMLKNENGVYTVTRQEAFDDILQYSGMSIRVTGKKGVRMITSMEKDKKNALVSGGLAGFTLKEYGTVVAWASKLADGNPLVLGQSYAMSNYAYKKGVADPVFAYSGSLMQYTNVLVNFSDEQCKNELALRPYMILEDENGETLTIYGGIVYRSIGYIAYQNRNVFEPQTEEYNYIWDIIHYVYGDVHDDDFVHAWTPSIK